MSRVTTTIASGVSDFETKRKKISLYPLTEIERK